MDNIIINDVMNDMLDCLERQDDSLKHKRRKADGIIPYYKICPTCDEAKTHDEFRKAKNKNKETYTLDSYCNECMNERKRESNHKYRQTLHGNIKSILSDAKRHAKKRLDKNRGEAGICTLTYDELLTIYNNQNGCCYYFTNQKLSLIKKSSWHISLRRLNTDGAYNKNNVVFVCEEFNVPTPWSKDKLNSMIGLFDKPFDVNQFLTDNNVNKFIYILVNSMKASSKKRGQICELEYIDVIDIIKQQKGRCAISNIPMSFEQKTNWKASPERLDPTNGYTKENCVFICVEFQGSCNKGSGQEENESNVGQQAQWTKEKFELYKTYLLNIVNMDNST